MYYNLNDGKIVGMNIRRPAILFLSAFIVGILVAYENIPILLKCAIVFIAFFLYIKLFVENKLYFRILIVICLFLLFGFFRFKYESKKFDSISYKLEELGKGNKVMTGKVLSIGKSTNSNYYILDNCTIDNILLGKCRIYFNDEIGNNVKIGNLIKTTCGVSVIESPMNEGEFNQKNYYRSEGISFIAFARDIDITNEKYDVLRQKIYEIKNIIKSQIDKIFNAKDAGLFTGMVTGDRSKIDKEQKKMFSENGIAHIIAISGLHLSILGLAFFNFLRHFLSVNISGGIVSIFIFIYAIFIDASATSLRAITMLYIRFMSYAIGRTYDSKNTLYIICFIFLILHPYLLFNAGFQFSYVAIFALNTDVKIEMRKRIKIKIPQVLILTLFLFPITIFHYFTYPLYSIFLNLIVIPLMTFVLGFGLAGLAISFINLQISMLFSFVVHIIFYIYDKLCLIIDKLPYNILWLGRPTLYEVLYYYIALFLIIYSLNNLYKVPQNRYFDKKLRKSSLETSYYDSEKGKLKPFYKMLNILRVVFSIFLIIISIVLISIRVNSDLRMTFISIGQGDSALVEAKNIILSIDGGSSSNNSNGQYILLPHIKSRAINHIDYAFITHADSDHTNGILYLLQNEDDLKIYNLVLPINAENDQKFEKIKNAAKDANANIIYLKEKDVMNFENGMGIVILSPDNLSATDKKYDQNELSLTFRFNYNNHSALFTGDIGKTTINRMLNDEYDVLNMGADVLKVPHHGSKNSNVLEFFDRVDPKLAVVSYGKNNNYGHPNKETVDNLINVGAKVLKTGEKGQIDIFFDKEYIYYTTFMNND